MADKQEQPRRLLAAVLGWSVLRESFGLRRSIAASAVVLGLILLLLASATS